jgi:hypothetical protein
MILKRKQRKIQDKKTVFANLFYVLHFLSFKVLHLRPHTCPKIATAINTGINAVGVCSKIRIVTINGIDA